MATEAVRLRQQAIESMLFPQLTREEVEGVLVVDRSEGLYVWDTDGNRYLDGGSGGPYAVNVGHGREEIAKAAYDQMARAHYFMPWASITPVAVEFARKLAEITPGDLNYSFMSNAGCMAVEAAFKAVRQYFLFNGPDKRRYKIITRRGAYHGVTLGALAATGSYYPIRQMGEPLPPGYYFAAAPYCYRCDFGREYPGCNLECALSIETLIKQESPEQVAAVVGEVVMGAAGMIPPPPEYWPKVREICDKYGIFLIDDEVVCGFGRTGKWFGIEHYGVVPDVMAMAKGISSAYLPLAATAVTKKIADGLSAYWNVHTYNHHPVCCAVGLKNIEIIERENLVDNAAEMGKYLLDQLQGLARQHPTVGEVRGLGLMTALELVKDRQTKEPFKHEDRFAMRLVEECRKRGLLLRQAEWTCLEFVPSLNVSKAQIDEMVRIADEALAAVEKEYGYH